MSRVIGHRTSDTPTVLQALGVRTAARATDDDPDKYLDKLVKYLPAEVTAIAAAFFAAFSLTDAGLWIALIVLALVNGVYLMVHAKASKTVPHWYFYLLATIAFGAWAIATIDDVADAFNLDSDAQRAFVLAAAAFVIPLVDEGLGLIFGD
jgi:hypothetical protein